MNLDLEAMKAAALAATPGEWHAPGLAELHDASNRVIACFSDVDPVAQEERPQPDIEEGDRNARFVALACPAAVLALIERLDLAEQDNRALLGAMHRQTRLLDHAIDEHAANAMLIEENDRLQAKAERIQKTGSGHWLDEPMDLDEFYSKPRVKPDLIISSAGHGGVWFWLVAISLVAVPVGAVEILGWWLR